MRRRIMQNGDELIWVQCPNHWSQLRSSGDEVIKGVACVEMGCSTPSNGGTDSTWLDQSSIYFRTPYPDGSFGAISITQSYSGTPNTYYTQYNISYDESTTYQDKRYVNYTFKGYRENGSAYSYSVYANNTWSQVQLLSIPNGAKIYSYSLLHATAKKIYNKVSGTDSTKCGIFLLLPKSYVKDVLQISIP